MNHQFSKKVAELKIILAVATIYKEKGKIVKEPWEFKNKIAPKMKSWQLWWKKLKFNVHQFWTSWFWIIKFNVSEILQATSFKMESDTKLSFRKEQNPPGVI